MMIKNIKTFFVKFPLADTSYFDTDLFLDFNPHEMIVKKVDFISADLVNLTSFYIRSSIVNNYIGYARSDPDRRLSNELQTRFQIKNQIRGTYRFSFHDIGDTDMSLTGELVICLEFVEY